VQLPAGLHIQNESRDNSASQTSEVLFSCCTATCSPAGLKEAETVENSNRTEPALKPMHCNVIPHACCGFMQFTPTSSTGQLTKVHPTTTQTETPPCQTLAYVTYDTYGIGNTPTGPTCHPASFQQVCCACLHQPQPKQAAQSPQHCQNGRAQGATVTSLLQRLHERLQKAAAATAAAAGVSISVTCRCEICSKRHRATTVL
jgi:hypothetical protein